MPCSHSQGKTTCKSRANVHTGTWLSLAETAKINDIKSTKALSKFKLQQPSQIHLPSWDSFTRRHFKTLGALPTSPDIPLQAFDHTNPRGTRAVTEGCAFDSRIRIKSQYPKSHASNSFHVGGLIPKRVFCTGECNVPGLAAQVQHPPRAAVICHECVGEVALNLPP